MQRVTTALLLLVMLAATLAWGQAAPAMPKPGPEHQRLHYFAGTWHDEGTMQPSPMGPGGKMTATENNQMLGDFFLTMHSEGTGPMGPMKEMAAMGYDPKTKTYSYDGFNSMGMHETAKGTVSGKTWTWTNEEEMGGKKMKMRFVIQEVSPTSYTYKGDMSADGKTWTTTMEGKATKAK